MAVSADLRSRAGELTSGGNGAAANGGRCRDGERTTAAARVLRLCYDARKQRGATYASTPLAGVPTTMAGVDALPKRRSRERKLKSNGSNFTDWFRHVRIFLNGGNLQYVLDAPLGDPPAETETDENMNKELPELFAMLKSAEIEIKKEHQVLMVNKTTSFKKHDKSKGKNKNSGKKAATPPVKPKAGPKPDGECYYCKEKGHWKRNCSKYLADLKSGLVKKKKEGTKE
ncbi:hypothetical protein QYE76_058560 [Lolium multiflorum]|uniref:CCHC-type domain-containing protein n=1 Tax=Lolium multiflorum TaxID=4521 RepID=A0AAD8T730_LOLMU|nr:hypothetical protein QYE76_058560 [Lolium multiflorum]